MIVPSKTVPDGIQNLGALFYPMDTQVIKATSLANIFSRVNNPILNKHCNNKKLVSVVMSHQFALASYYLLFFSLLSKYLVEPMI